MASLVFEKKEVKEHEQNEVDGLFALGINVRCVDLSWTYDKVIITSSNNFPTQPLPSSSFFLHFSSSLGYHLLAWW